MIELNWTVKLVFRWLIEKFERGLLRNVLSRTHPGGAENTESKPREIAFSDRHSLQLSLLEENLSIAQ